MPNEKKNTISHTGAENGNLLALRGESKFLSILPSQAEGLRADPPRALRGLASIIEGELCHRCGSCIGICPTDVLKPDQDEFPAVANLSACTDCDLCVKVCPGTEFDAPSFTKEKFSQELPVKDMHGIFEAAYLSYATKNNVRAEISTSGGFVTALLVSLLRQGKIDGAVVVASAEDELWKGRPILARTEEEIISAAKSKYAISPTNIVLSEIRKTPGRYALVGLPCQIHGFLKAARLDRKLSERVVLTIGLFCHAAIEHDPMRYIWDNLGVARKDIVRFISRVGKHPGTPHVELTDGSLRPVYFPDKTGYRPNSMEMLNILYRLYTPARCLSCYDSTAEYADIAVGDPWMPKPGPEINFQDGYSFVLARTRSGIDMINLASRNGDLHNIEITADAARRSNTMMGHEKRWRAFRVVEMLARRGRPAPRYGFTTPQPGGKHLLMTEINMLSHIFCFIKTGRLPLLKLSLSFPGYLALWLNNQRRQLRFWRKETVATFKRKFLGEKALKEE